MDVHAVELHKVNELGNIPDQFRPSWKKVMLRLSGAVALFADIIAHELESFGKDETLFQTQGEMIG